MALRNVTIVCQTYISKENDDLQLTCNTHLHRHVLCKDCYPLMFGVGVGPYQWVTLMGLQSLMEGLQSDLNIEMPKLIQKWYIKYYLYKYSYVCF